MMDQPAAGRTVAPKYVSYGGEQVFQQPYSALGTAMYTFLLPINGGNREVAQQFIDRVLNIPSGGAVDYQIVFPTALLSFQRFDRLGAKYPPDTSKGGFSYQEATLWLPVTNQNELVANLSYFVPYIFADNHFAIAAGREVYGYPKALGTVNMPPSTGDEMHFSVTTEVLTRFDPAQIGQQKVLIEVAPLAAQRPCTSLWCQWTHAAEHVAERMAEGALDDVAEFAVEQLLEPKATMVFLKQFRDAANGGDACYQAIIEGAGAVTHFHGGGPLEGKFQVTFHSADSHPICNELGLDASYQVHGFYVEFSFDILPGRELWKAG